jgi:sugar lactone lactonase YvrE
MRIDKTLFSLWAAVLLAPLPSFAAAGQVAIAPSLVHAALRSSHHFTVQVGGHPAKSVTWSVNDAAGGNAEFGTITASGVYTAPAAVPSPREIHIQAKIGGKTHAWATVIVGEGAPEYRLVSKWGERGDGPGKFVDPHALCFSRDGNLVITDAIGGHVYRYTKDGKYLGEIGSGPGSGPGQFKGPRDVKTDKKGDIYVSDGDNHRIQVFSPEGKLLRSFGQKGKAPGEMLRVHAIWFGPDERLYAADVDNSRIMVFNKSGKLLFEWGKDGRGPGEFHAPHGLGGDANGNIFVSNYWGSCQKFTSEGKYLFEFAVPDQAAFNHAHSMTSDRWGNAYLMARDKSNRAAIVKYNNNGTWITTWPALRPTKEWGVKSALIDSDGTVYAAVESKESVGIEVYREQ